jgi:hypothetical protein
MIVDCDARRQFVEEILAEMKIPRIMHKNFWQKFQKTYGDYKCGIRKV